MEERKSRRINSVIETLCEAENEEVVLRFGSPMTVPCSKYDGSSYQTEMLPKATMHTTIDRASVEDIGDTLLCSGKVHADEMDRVGIDPSVVWTEHDSDSCTVDIQASRQYLPDEYGDLTIEEAEKAIEQNREEEVLPPWKDFPTVLVTVKRTSELMVQTYDPNGIPPRGRPPRHEVGSLTDVRIK